MDSLNILAWNASAAASADFRRVFRELMTKYKPNVVLLIKTFVGRAKGQRAVSALGYAGGMWLLWGDECIKLTVHGNTFQEIHTTVGVQGLPSLFLSFIYGNPDRTIRNCMWNNLVSLGPLVV